MIEVGEYVRNKSGVIRKVTKIIPIYENGLLLSDSYYIEFDGLGDVGTYKNKQAEKMFIIKHSKNIIDLIENGDFITLGRDCYPLRVDTIWKNGEDLNIKLDNDAEFEDIKNDDEFEIFSIVTHEQFAQMEYKL